MTFKLLTDCSRDLYWFTGPHQLMLFVSTVLVNLWHFRQISGLTLKCCPFLFQLPGQMLWDSTAQSKRESDPSSQSCMSAPRVLWALTDHEEELKKQVRKPKWFPALFVVMWLVCVSAASVSFPDAPPTVYECWEEASEREWTAQETYEEDGKVTT